MPTASDINDRAREYAYSVTCYVRSRDEALELAIAVMPGCVVLNERVYPDEQIGEWIVAPAVIVEHATGCSLVVLAEGATDAHRIASVIAAHRTSEQIIHGVAAANPWLRVCESPINTDYDTETVQMQSTTPSPDAIDVGHRPLTTRLTSTIRRTFFRDLRADAAQQYDDIVRRIAAGEDPSADDVRASLLATGKTLDDLEADVTDWPAKDAARKALASEDDRLTQIHAMVDQAREMDAPIADAQTRLEALQREVAELRSTREDLIRRANGTNHSVWREMRQAEIVLDVAPRSEQCCYLNYA